MAKSIMLYSPWQFVFWYDRPKESPHKKGGAGTSRRIIEENEALGFYDALVTVWDDTKILDGKIGKYATVARKTGDNWFVGTLVANEAKEIDIPLSFLDTDSNYEATIYFQNSDDLRDEIVQIEKISVTTNSVLSKYLVANSGVAVIIRKI